MDEDDEDTIIDGPKVLSSVSMALTFRKFPSQISGSPAMISCIY